MEKYINYIFSEIIKDFNGFGEIYNNYVWLTWIIIWILWLVYIWLKYLILTCPIWLLFNMCFGNNTKFIKFKPKSNT